MLGRWDKRLVDQASDVKVVFFVIYYRLRALKTLYFCNFLKNWKNWKGFCKEFCKTLCKKSTWNIKRLVDESFVLSAQRTSVLYCRLLDFWKVVHMTRNKTKRVYNDFYAITWYFIRWALISIIYNGDNQVWIYLPG